MITTNQGKVLEPGDKIKCQGITCTIKKVVFQNYWEGAGFYADIIDTNGVHRNWKQYVDGGEVIPKQNI